MKSASRLARSFLFLVGSSLLVQACLFFGVIYLSRLYSPAAFGEYGFYAGIASVVAIVSGLRFDYLRFSEQISKETKASFLAFSLIATALFVCVALVVSQLISACFPDKSNFVIWLVLFVLSYSTFYQASQLILVDKHYKAFSVFRLLQVVTFIGVAVAAYGFYPRYGLSLAAILSQLVLAGFSLKLIAAELDFLKWSQMKVDWLAHYGKALANTGVSLLQYSTPFAPLLMGAIFYSEEDVGAYFLFSQLISSPLSIIRRSFMNFLNAELNTPQKMSALIRGRRDRLLKALIVISLVAAFGAIFMLAFGKEVVSFVLGESWAGYGFLIAPMLVYYIFDALLQPLTTLLPLWGRHKLSLKIEGLRFFSVFILLPLMVLVMPISFFAYCIVFYSLMIIFYLAIVASLTSKVDYSA